VAKVPPLELEDTVTVVAEAGVGERATLIACETVPAVNCCGALENDSVPFGGGGAVAQP
jgi:hypothetical protein